MILTAEFASTFNCNYIFAFFNNADDGVITARVTTNTAFILFGNIAADCTKLHTLFNHTN